MITQTAPGAENLAKTRSKRLGLRTVRFENPPNIKGFASIAGKREGEGPLRETFDIVADENSFGETSWEKSESRMVKDVLALAVTKSQLSMSDIQYIFAGDLINQCIASSFGLRESSLSFFGIYGACSNMAEGLGLASAMIDGCFADYACALTSSHFCSAERQYRLPLDYGGQRPPTAQWTVTGAGAVVLSKDGPGPYVTHMATGRIVDRGIKDANNMGSAMAPAAVDTLEALFTDTKLTPADFDLILTGDLGSVGLGIAADLMKKDGLNFNGNLEDCGVLIFDPENQDVHAGGSGCGCSASVLCGKILSDMTAGKLKKVLFAGTGALLSPVSTQQGESIPSICHAVVISTDRK